MRTLLVMAATIVVTNLSLHCVDAQVPGTSDDPLRHGHALLIGNSHYRDPSWAPLDDIPLQLAQLEKGLKDHFDTVDVVQDLEAITLSSTINEFIRERGNDSEARLLVYYAGHGYTEIQRNENRGYITGIDTPGVDGTQRGYNAARLKAVSMPEIRAALERAPAKSILLLFDSCFAGTIFTDRAGDDAPQPLTRDIVAQLIERPARDIITAGRSDQKVPAHSPIPELLLAALSGAADPYKHGVISSSEIHLYLKHRVQQMHINLVPQVGKLPNPDFAEGTFLFRVPNATVAVQDESESISLYRADADRGNVDAEVKLAHLYQEGLGGLPKNEREAARLYKIAADQGSATGQASLGSFYEQGRGGLLNNDREAERLYKLAADQGNAAGQAGLGSFYSGGRGGLQKDDNEAVRLFKLAADQGNASAQANLGLFYDSGRGGLQKDDREAARLYKLAANQGSASGQANLGFFYETGRGGLKQDNGEAERLYKLATDQGNTYGQIATVFELVGTWAAGGSPGPKISRSGNALTLEMSAYARAQASGSVIDAQTIVVTFNDEGIHAGRLWPSGTIAWSNRTFWAKLSGSATPGNSRARHAGHRQKG